MEDNTFAQYTEARKASVRAIMRKEFTDFFVTMTSVGPRGWASVDDQEFVEALADSLLSMGTLRNLDTAYLQTLVHELQDRINNKLN